MNRWFAIMSILLTLSLNCMYTTTSNTSCSIVGLICEMSDEVSYWNPPKLYVLSLKAVAGIIKEWFDKGGANKIMEAELAFPASMCNHLVARFTSTFFASKNHYSRSILSAVMSSPWCRFTKLHMKYSRDGLYYWPPPRLDQYPLTELIIECDASDCKYVNLMEIGRPVGNTLVALTLKHCVLKYDSLQHGLSCLVKLVHLTMHCVSFHEAQNIKRAELSALPCLEILDLSFARVQAIEDIFSVQRNIKVLQLYDVPIKMETMSLLTNLVVLDLSRKLHTSNVSLINESALMTSLSGMPSLKSLDVSCREISTSDVQLFDQPHHRMTFLGLFNTTQYNHQNINADMITGDHTEGQILLGLELYKQRYDYVYELLFSLANFHSPVMENEQGLEAVLELCNSYCEDGPLLVVATASIYLYLKGEEIKAELKRKTIWTLVDIMTKHKNYPRLVQNCCICLYPYQTMQDSGFVVTKLATSLVYLIQHTTSVHTLFMVLLGLSKLIWWLPKPKKIWLARLNIIEITLNVLMDMNSLDPHGLQDSPLDLMEACWNILWNMTDECPENCVLFCDSDGIEVTMTCYQSHREAFEDSMPSIFGALGNVVEVDELQKKVMNQAVMLALREAVVTDKHHRMGYSIGGVIANLAYNGDKFWGDVQPSRQSMLEFMVTKMQQWDIEGEIWIEFNSLKPLMKIVQSPEDMVAYWAVRTIAGLSKIRKERYCNLLHKEGVIPVFKEIASRSNCTNLSPSLPQLAEIIVQNYESVYSAQQPMDTT